MNTLISHSQLLTFVRKHRLLSLFLALSYVVCLSLKSYALRAGFIPKEVGHGSTQSMFATVTVTIMVLTMLTAVRIVLEEDRKAEEGEGGEQWEDAPEAAAAVRETWALEKAVDVYITVEEVMIARGWTKIHLLEVAVVLAVGWDLLSYLSKLVGVVRERDVFQAAAIPLGMAAESFVC